MRMDALVTPGSSLLQIYMGTSTSPPDIIVLYHSFGKLAHRDSTDEFFLLF
jgi:hypothetical protein